MTKLRSAGLLDDTLGLVRNPTNHYGVPRVVGFRNGYQGFVASYRHDVVDLTPQSVRDINIDGGTVLGTSRGPQDPQEVVDCLERLGISVLFVIGGDGTMRGAMQIASVIFERGARIAVVGVPKTIDNDIPYLDQSFGFQTAFARNAGLRDVGTLLRRRFAEHFAAAGIAASIPFIDPSYAIRSVPANPYDSVYCVRLAQAAVHAAMSGRTEMVVGRWRRRFVHIPMGLAVSKRNQVDLHGDLWMSVLEATGQPVRFGRVEGESAPS